MMSRKQNSHVQGLFKTTINSNLLFLGKAISVAPKDVHTPSIFSFPSHHPFALVVYIFIHALDNL